MGSACMGRRKLTTPAFKLKKDRRGNFGVTWTDPATGKTRRKACRTRDRDKAILIQPRIEAEALHPAPRASYTIGELIDAYMADRAQGEYSKSFAHNFTQVRVFFGSYFPSQLNDPAFRRYRKYRAQQRVANAGALTSKAKPKLVSDATAVRELNALRGAIGWAKRNHWKGLENVTVHLPDSAPNVQLRFLTREEVERLLKACIEPHTALFVRISLATGARMSAQVGQRILPQDRQRYPAVGRT
jgi:integrase